MSNILLKQGQPEWAAQGCVQFGVGCLPEGKLHAALVSLQQGLNTVTIGKKKKVIYCIQLESDMFQFVPIAPRPVSRTTDAM